MGHRDDKCPDERQRKPKVKKKKKQEGEEVSLYQTKFVNIAEACDGWVLVLIKLGMEQALIHKFTLVVPWEVPQRVRHQNLSSY